MMYNWSVRSIGFISIHSIIFLSISIPCIAGLNEAEKEAQAQDVKDTAAIINVSEGSDHLNLIKTFPVSPDAQVHRIVVGGESGSVAATETELTNKLVYSNTFGSIAAQIPANELIADDLVLLSQKGCLLDRFTFEVTGQANPDGVGGAYRVDFGLYDGCPGAGGKVISGTDGFVEFDDGGSGVIQHVEIIIPDNVGIFIHTSQWLGLITSRENVGIIMGAPAMVGFSEDIVDFPGFACNANLGGFPFFGHASFNSEVYVRGECPDAFPAYHNVHDARGEFNPGENVWLADDLELGVETCEMVGYEVAIRGVGFYTFEMLADAEGLPGTTIENTRKFIINNESGTLQLHSFKIVPPITIDKHVWMAARVGNNIAGWVLTGRDASWGRTNGYFVIKNTSDRWVTQFPPPPNHGGFYVNIICAGQQTVGACCNMFIGECVGGRDDGKICGGNGDCKNPGTCEAVCREIPRMNCTFYHRGSTNQPSWMEGYACDPDPFPFVCGAAACCKPDDTCENLTENECNDVEPVEDPRLWRPGQYCDERFQECPFSACLRREGDCVVAHPEPGCENPFCCVDICNTDLYCCEVEWDRLCAQMAIENCGFSLPNDECYDPREGHGVKEIATDSTTDTLSQYATRNQDDPGFCCFRDDPGAFGNYTTWYKFVAAHSLITIDTLEKNNPYEDSLIQVFAIGDSTDDETACDTLIPIECNDDAILYENIETNSKIVLDDLISGETYYILVASKYKQDLTLALDSPGLILPPANDDCDSAKVVTDGDIEINDINATVDCNVDSCGFDVEVDGDVWFDYEATCTGRLHISPCVSGSLWLNLLAVYEGCDCPDVNSIPMLCKQPDDFGRCYNRSARIISEVTKDQCYKIRVGKHRLNTTEGFINVECIYCDTGTINWMTLPEGVIDARRPHDPDDMNASENPKEFLIRSPHVDQTCWSLCDTLQNNPDFIRCFPEGNNNWIREIVKVDDETYKIILRCPLLSGEITTFVYRDDQGNTTNADFTMLPGDVDTNLTVDTQDIDELMNILRLKSKPNWGEYSADIDRSGEIHPADILQLIDLMNGAGAFKPWLNATLSPTDNLCP